MDNMVKFIFNFPYVIILLMLSSDMQSIVRIRTRCCCASLRTSGFQKFKPNYIFQCEFQKMTRLIFFFFLQICKSEVIFFCLVNYLKNWALSFSAIILNIATLQTQMAYSIGTTRETSQCMMGLSVMIYS